MSDGGISKKTVKMITEKSRVIKDYIDLRIYNLIDTVQIDASFLVQSRDQVTATQTAMAQCQDTGASDCAIHENICSSAS